MKKLRNLKVELSHQSGATVLVFSGPDGKMPGIPMDMNAYARDGQF